uniref:Calponin-homology (CH) domain-containing protein n=1 Tax=Rhodnius prolixus TaxID=13249 RepID=T1HN52_RHOPR
MLKDLYPDLCLPPEPILTRWGTWLEAAQYYYENYNKIKNVLSHLEDEAVAINTAKSLFEKPNLRNDLAFISDNCVFLAQAITQLESQNVRLTENVSNVKKVIEKVEGIPGSQKITKVKKEKCDFLCCKSSRHRSIYRPPGWVEFNIPVGGALWRTFDSYTRGHAAHVISFYAVSLSAFAAHREKGRMRFHCLQNVELVLNFLRYKKIKLVNIRPEDIVDGNPKLTLGLIWTIILHYQVWLEN